MFVGVRDNLWECPQNWKTADNKVPETAPCDMDRAIFPEVSRRRGRESAAVTLGSLCCVEPCLLV